MKSPAKSYLTKHGLASLKEGGIVKAQSQEKPAFRVIHVLKGGPMMKISVNKKIIEFEMHPYCGPTILNRKGDPLKNQPMTFLKAASLWAQQGKRTEKGLCRWDREPKEILKHLGGRHWQLLGYETAERGE